MTIDLTAAAPWLAWVTALAALAYTIYTNRSKDNDRRFESVLTKIGDVEVKLDQKASNIAVSTVTAKVDVLEDGLLTLRNDFKHLPDKDITHRLEMSISDMRTEMRGLAEQIKPIAAIAARVQDAVMEKVMSE